LKNFSLGKTNNICWRQIDWLVEVGNNENKLLKRERRGCLNVRTNKRLKRGEFGYRGEFKFTPMDWRKGKKSNLKSNRSRKNVQIYSIEYSICLISIKYPIKQAY